MVLRFPLTVWFDISCIVWEITNQTNCKNVNRSPGTTSVPGVFVIGYSFLKVELTLVTWWMQDLVSLSVNIAGRGYRCIEEPRLLHERLAKF